MNGSNSHKIWVSKRAFWGQVAERKLQEELQAVQGYLAHKRALTTEDRCRALGIAILKGPRGLRFLMREVPLSPHTRTHQVGASSRIFALIDREPLMPHYALPPHLAGKSPSGPLPTLPLITASPQRGTKSPVSNAVICTTRRRILANTCTNQGPENGDLVPR